MEMETRYNSNGDLIIQVDEETMVRISKRDGVVIKQELGNTERVFLSVSELRQIVGILNEKEGYIGTECK